MLTSAAINQTSTKPLIQLKTEPETVAVSGIFVKSEPDIKPEIFIGSTESDLSQEMSDVNDDPLKISVHEEKEHHVSSVHERKNCEILPHPNRLMFSCFICSKIFKSHAHVKMHISADHGGRKLNYKCPICSYLFSNQNSLKEHVERFHNKKGKLQCSICLKEFSSIYTVKTHISNVHEGNEKFACVICSKVFGAKGTLKRHMYNVHEKKKPFQCTSCPIWFGSKKFLENHFRKVHEGKEIDIQDTNDGNNLSGHQENSEIILPD